MKKVVKFGGSSLASAEQFKKVGEIIRADEGRRYVIPSAPGKRFNEDIKVTDMLYQCYALAQEGKNFDKELMAIKTRYDEIISGLELNLSLDEEFEIIKRNFHELAGSDYAASRGEYLNGIVMANYLGYEFIDAADYIFFHDDGTYNPVKTEEILGIKLDETERAVIPGFYGSYDDGRVKTFSRGGSDVTGSIVAAAAKVDMYENWTDVSGFLIADPRIIHNPKTIKSITYKELRELAYMGATVLHEDAIFPVRKEGIPINIKNTNKPNDTGTYIRHDREIDSTSVVSGISCDKDFTVLNIKKYLMNRQIGFTRKILAVLEDYDISFDHMPSGIDNISIIMRSKEIQNKEEKVLNDIRKHCDVDELSIEHDLAVLMVVGEGMHRIVGTANTITHALAEANINLKMMNQGASEISMMFGIDVTDAERAVNATYEYCYTKKCLNV